jgi:hypothetical protein
MIQIRAAEAQAAAGSVAAAVPVPPADSSAAAIQVAVAASAAAAAQTELTRSHLLAISAPADLAAPSMLPCGKVSSAFPILPSAFIRVDPRQEIFLFAIASLTKTR